MQRSNERKAMVDERVNMEKDKSRVYSDNNEGISNEETADGMRTVQRKVMIGGKSGLRIVCQ